MISLSIVLCNKCIGRRGSTQEYTGNGGGGNMHVLLKDIRSYVIFRSFAGYLSSVLDSLQGHDAF